MGLDRLCLGVLAALLGSGVLHASDLAKAEDRYKHTDFEGSLALLDKHSSDAASNFLVARNYYMTATSRSRPNICKPL